MKYVAIDIETTGLDREKDQILEFGAIIEDTENPLPFDEIPKFHKYIMHDRYEGGAYALALNQRIFNILAKGEDPDITTERGMAVEFLRWCVDNGGSYNVNLSVAGKNYRDFDHEFLIRIPYWKEKIKFQRRVIDPTILYWNPKEDVCLPNQNTCLKRAGINEVVDHTALGDAWQIILLNRKYFEKM